jgi:hypothetical protein
MAFAVALIHPIEIRREKCGLVPTGAGPDLHDGVAVGVRISWQEKFMELGRESRDLGGESSQVGLYQRYKLSVRFFSQSPSLFQFVLKARQPIGQADHGSQAGVLAAE